MSVELRQLRYFVAVAEELHFHRAAERLHIAQPALSRTIRALETDLGCALLSRTTRRVSLTDAGRVFLDEARTALHQVDNAAALARDAAGGKVGHLSVAYMDFAINGPLPRILSEFRRDHPGIVVDLHHLWTEKQRYALVAGEIDMGFMIGPFDAPGIASTVVARERLVAVLPEQHPLARRKSVSLPDLAGEPFVLGSMETWGPFRQVVGELCLAAGFVPNVVQEAHNSDGIFGLVAAGMGVTLYVETARHLSLRGSVSRPLADTDATVETVAAWQAREPSAAVRLFAKHTRQAEASQPR